MNVNGSKARRTIRTCAAALSVAAGLVIGGSTPARGADVFAIIGESDGNLDRLDITTGSLATIKNNGTVYSGLAYNANETVLYGIVSNAVLAPTSLVTINPRTGVDTPVGSNGVSLTTLANLSDGRLFGVDASDRLYQVNPSTGATTLIGSTGLPSLSAASTFDNSLASNGSALYYTLDTPSLASALYTLSLTTGAAAEVGPTGTSGIVGSAFAGPTFASGQLYGFGSNSAIDTIDLTTGAATYLNANGRSDIFGGVGVVTVVPEPAAASLLLAGAAGAGMLRRRRRPRPGQVARASAASNRPAASAQV